MNRHKHLFLSLLIVVTTKEINKITLTHKSITHKIEHIHQTNKNEHVPYSLLQEPTS